MRGDADGRPVGARIVADAMMRFEGDVEPALGGEGQTLGIGGAFLQRCPFDILQQQEWAGGDPGDPPAVIALQLAIDRMPPVGEGKEGQTVLIEVDGRKAAEDRIIHMPAIAAQIGRDARLSGIGCKTKPQTDRRDRA